MVSDTGSISEERRFYQFAGGFALVGVAITFTSLFPAYYKYGDSLAESSLTFNLLQLGALAAGSITLLTARSRRVGAAILVGASLGVLEYILSDISGIIANNQAAGPGFAISRVGETLYLIGAGLAVVALVRDLGLRTSAANAWVSVLAGLVGLTYAIGKALPAFNTSISADTIENAFSSPTAFTDVDIYTLWTVLGMLVVVLIPVLGGLISDLRVGAALMAGLNAVLISVVVVRVSELGPNNGMEEDLAEVVGPGIAVGANVSMNAGLILQLVAVGVLTVLVIVVGLLAGGQEHTAAADELPRRPAPHDDAH